MTAKSFFPAFVLLLVLSPVLCLANSAPVVSNVTATQRNDDSKLVDIYYNLADADGDNCTVWVVISDDGGTTWQVPAMTCTGNVGSGVTPGNSKHIIWDAGKDVPGKVTTFKARVYADDGKGPNSMVLVPAGSFAYQGNYTTLTYLGTFMIDKYEVTNDQYCAFLNNNDPAGAHYASGMGIDQQGTSGNYSYSVQTGKGSYPITYVSALDAEAYAAWRSLTYGGTYRLPTEQEWEKAAGWNPATQYEYCLGYQLDTIDCGYCNFNNCYGGPLPVGSFNGMGGKHDAKSYYGCYDMSGNVCEWISPTDGSLRGGCWYNTPSYCTVTYRSFTADGPTGRYSSLGFRLVLDLN